ncbi:hypothetical protein [Rhizobium lentis]|uniref:hypothetical protein n=1 Tax=Rhizobium lentis TaxID=1138194 RepID=UPI001C838E29|nr:hypothetical protein [Rhizobium lentis]MBX5045857.1 hypothetical protein [Rhizobium lentis]MBX5057869.1 hypothetical protein [Rhizobium lentis]
MSKLEMQGFYLLNGNLPLYIKYSRSRKGPRVFNFHREHQECIRMLAERYAECLVAFVCDSDGIPAVNYGQLSNVLDDKFHEQEAVSIRRKLNEMYSISGKDGVLSSKISRDSLAILTRSLNSSDT